MTFLSSYSPPANAIAPSQFTLRLSYPSTLPATRTPLSPLSFLLRAALIKPHKLALIHPEKGFHFTYQQWAARILSLTFAIKSTKNWKAGDRVAVVSPNSPMILEAHNGILGAAGITVPIK